MLILMKVLPWLLRMTTAPRSINGQVTSEYCIWKKNIQSLEFRESNVGGLSKVTIRKKNCSWKLLPLFRKDGKLSRFKIPRKAISRILFTKKLTAKNWISQKLKENWRNIKKYWWFSRVPDTCILTQKHLK